MGTHPIFESDFDCLTEVVKMNEEDVPVENEQEGMEKRIQERRDRIAARERAKTEPQTDKTEEEDPAMADNPQIDLSLNRLKLLRNAGSELVSNVDIAAQAREFERRKEAHEAKKARIKKLADEADQSLEKFEAIRRRWTGSMAREIPQELRDALNDQVKACDDLLSGKNVLIADLNRELKSSEDEYVKTLKKQYDDLEIVSQRMEDQYKTMDSAYREEIKQIVNALDTQFHQRIVVWPQKADARREAEENFMEARLALREEQQAGIDELRLRDAEDLHATKIKLETDVQILEQQLESMRASYQLNQEKLEYNFQVLKKRDDENTITNSQQKRRLTRLQDSLNNLRAKLVKQETQYAEEALSLREDYRRLLQQYADFQKKKQRFEEADNKKFKEVWKMNQGELEMLVQRLHGADEIITEQQLGLKYSANEKNKNVKNERKVSVGRSALEFAQSIMSGETEIPIDVADRAFTILCSECHFLVEEKLGVLVENLETDERRLILLDAIFSALNVDSDAELADLIRALSEVQAITENGCDPNLAFKGILSYVNAALKGKDGASLNGSENGKNGIWDWTIWDTQANVITDKKLRLWDALYEALKKYYDCLNSRANLINENGRLQQQNEELRVLLHQYVTSEVNKELQIPPSKVLNLE